MAKCLTNNYGDSWLGETRVQVHKGTLRQDQTSIPIPITINNNNVKVYNI